MTNLNIAVVGAGAIGRRHMHYLGETPGCTLAAVVDPSPTRDEIAAGHCPTYPDMDSMAAAMRPDGVILATPNHLHVPQALWCLDQGIPVLVEKPVAHDIAEGERLLAATQLSGVPVLVGHHRRHSAYMQAAVGIVQSGALGDIVAANAMYLLHKPDADGYFSDAPWRTRAGAGPLLLNTIHDIDNLRALCGEIVQVQAMLSSKARGFEVEDTAMVNLRFDSGALGTIAVSDCVTSNMSWEQTTVEDPVFTETRNDRDDCYTICGTMGHGRRADHAASVISRRDGQELEDTLRAVRRPCDPGGPACRAARAFRGCNPGSAHPIVTVEDGLNNLRVVEAIRKSAHTGCLVEVC